MWNLSWTLKNEHMFWKKARRFSKQRKQSVFQLGSLEKLILIWIQKQPSSSTTFLPPSPTSTATTRKKKKKNYTFIGPGIRAQGQLQLQIWLKTNAQTPLRFSVLISFSVGFPLQQALEALHQYPAETGILGNEKDRFQEI